MQHDAVLALVLLKHSQQFKLRPHDGRARVLIDKRNLVSSADPHQLDGCVERGIAADDSFLIEFRETPPSGKSGWQEMRRGPLLLRAEEKLEQGGPVIIHAI